MSTDAMIAVLFAGLFAAALAVRAWNNTQRIRAERRVEAHVRAAGSRFRMDPQASARIRAGLVSAAAAPLSDRLPAADYFADPDQPVPYALTPMALNAHRTAQRRCYSTMPYRDLRGGQSW